MSATATGYVVAPAWIAPINPHLYPEVWENGLTSRYRSPARSPTHAAHARGTLTVCVCVDMTPLGRPVVPDVKMMSARSSSVTTGGSSSVPLSMYSFHDGESKKTVRSTFVS